MYRSPVGGLVADRLVFVNPQRLAALLGQQHRQAETTPHLAVTGAFVLRHQAPADIVQFDQMYMRVRRPLRGTHSTPASGIETVVHENIERCIGLVVEQAVDVRANTVFGMIAVDEHEPQGLSGLADTLQSIRQSLLRAAGDEFDVGKLIREVRLAGGINVQRVHFVGIAGDHRQAAGTVGSDLDRALGSQAVQQCGQRGTLRIGHHPVVELEPGIQFLRCCRQADVTTKELNTHLVTCMSCIRRGGGMTPAPTPESETIDVRGDGDAAAQHELVIDFDDRIIVPVRLALAVARC